MKTEKTHFYHPWRRFGARVFDMSLYMFFVIIVADLLFSVNFYNLKLVSALFMRATVVIVTIFVEAFLVSKFKTTLGKWLFGLSVISAKGKHLTYEASLRTTAGAMIKGVGLWIPIYGLYRMIVSYKQNRTSELDWEIGIQFQFKAHSWKKVVLCVFAIISLHLSIGIFSEVMELPPNGGSLNIEDFSENYNHYAHYVGEGFENLVLDENGEFLEATSDGTLYDTWSRNEAYFFIEPEMQYHVKDGVIEKINLKFDIKNKELHAPNSVGDLPVYSLILAFVNANENEDIFSKNNKIVLDNIMKHANENHEFTVGNARISWKIESEGYQYINKPYKYKISPSWSAKFQDSDDFIWDIEMELI